MRLDLARLLGPLLAALALLLVLQQTQGALRAGGVWGQRRSPVAPTASPFARIESLLAAAAAPPAASRDPFSFERAPAPAPTRRPAPRTAPAPAAPDWPVLTSIVWLESNPSATLRWNGQDYPVQTSTLFDEFQVQSITRTQVTLVRGGQTFVLQLPKKGE